MRNTAILAAVVAVLAGQGAHAQGLGILQVSPGDNAVGAVDSEFRAATGSTTAAPGRAYLSGSQPLRVRQKGSGNRAGIELRGAASDPVGVTVEQTGGNHSAQVYSESRTNGRREVIIRQAGGDRNRAEVSTRGLDVYGGASGWTDPTTGTADNATVRQQGSDNRLRVIGSDDPAAASHLQLGMRQIGSGNSLTAQVTAPGGSLELRSAQTGSGNRGTITTNNSNGLVAVSQDATGGQADVTLAGAHRASVTVGQFGWSQYAPGVTGGNGGRVSALVQGDDQQVRIGQHGGSDNETQVEVRGGQSSVTAHSVGEQNRIGSLCSGTACVAAMTADGTGNALNVSIGQAVAGQDGTMLGNGGVFSRRNTVDATVSGNHNGMTVGIQGDDNRATFSQLGGGNQAILGIVGGSNVFSLRQDSTGGLGHAARIQIEGGASTVSVDQAGVTRGVVNLSAGPGTNVSISQR